MNTAKLKYDYEEKSVAKAQQLIVKKFKTLLDLKLSQVLTAMYD